MSLDNLSSIQISILLVTASLKLIKILKDYKPTSLCLLKKIIELSLEIEEFQNDISDQSDQKEKELLLKTEALINEINLERLTCNTTLH